MNKYLVKPTKIIDEKGYKQTLDDYIENNLPSGGNSGEDNNQEVNELIAAIDSRVETLEQNTIKKTHNIATVIMDKPTSQDNLLTYSNGNSLILDSINSTTQSVADLIDVVNNHRSRLVTLEANNTSSSTPTVTETVIQQKANTRVDGGYYELDSGYDKDFTINDVDDIHYIMNQNDTVLCQVVGSNTERIKKLEANTLTETDLTAINNTLTTHTNTLQSLDTRTGSHTASIGQLENKMTDVETLANGNKTKLITESDINSTQETAIRAFFSYFMLLVQAMSSSPNPTEWNDALSRIVYDLQNIMEGFNYGDHSIYQ